MVNPVAVDIFRKAVEAGQSGAEAIRTANRATVVLYPVFRSAGRLVYVTIPESEGNE
jgi:hypothetical protein